MLKDLFGNVDAYVYSVVKDKVADPNNYDDVFQECKIVLWEYEQRIISGEKILEGNPTKFFKGVIKRTAANYNASAKMRKRWYGDKREGGTGGKGSHQVYEAYYKPGNTILKYMDEPYKGEDSSESTGHDFFMRPEPDFSSSVIDKHTIEQLFNVLTDRERECVEYMYYDGMSPTEVGQKMGLTSTRISVLRKHAYEKMRAALEV